MNKIQARVLPNLALSDQLLFVLEIKEGRNDSVFFKNKFSFAAIEKKPPDPIFFYYYCCLNRSKNLL
jgi:hypothetical protein